MIKIIPDKEGKLTQWDLDRKVIVTGYDGVAEVHFASPGDDHGAYVVKLIDGQAEIPNVLLTMAGTINVYVYPADRTVFATTLWVMAREKPDDYIYTETEVLSYKTLDEKIGDLAELTTIAKENLVAAINEAAQSGSGTDISLGVTGASVGDIIKVKQVDADGKPTAWEAATAKLANPNALTFTGAVTGTYDGSTPLSVEIPSGGGGGDSEWEYLGEFTIDTQPTFEIGKYNLFYVTGYATLDAQSTNAYLRPSIDGTRHFPWTIAFNTASKMFFGLFAPNFSIAYYTNGSNYAGLTIRGNGTLSLTESDDFSKGTAYITLSGGGANDVNLVEYKMKIFGKP